MSALTYNPATSKYESPDPWADAPLKGIRVINPWGTCFVHSEEGYTFKYRGTTWVNHFASHGGRAHLESWMKTHRGEIALGNQWPDFEGAPEGFRIYYKHPSGWWDPQVITEDGGFYDRDFRVKNTMWNGSVDTPAKRLAWYWENWPVILVDEIPADEPEATVEDLVEWGEVAEWEKELLGATKATDPEPECAPKPGDVIRNTATGDLWMLYERAIGKGKKVWYQVGAGNPGLPRIVQFDDFVLPDQWRFVSRGVAK